MLKGIRDNPLIFHISQAQHSMSLSTASLSISENSAVVASDDRLNKRESSLIINFFLGAINSINRIVGEKFFISTSRPVRLNHNLICRFVNVANALAPCTRLKIEYKKLLNVKGACLDSYLVLFL